MRPETITGARGGAPSWVWWRDAASLILVWMRAFPRLGRVLYFTAGVLMLLLVKSVVRAFGHPS
jgi:hypothetical protein